MAARLLHRAGIPFRLLEARPRFGGRIHSVDDGGAAARNGFDLGPSWFWPGTQPRLASLIAELGIDSFPQHEEGDFVVQPARGAMVQRYPSNGIGQVTSTRLSNGMGALVSALVRELPPDRLQTGIAARAARKAAGGVVVDCAGPAGARIEFRADAVILAMPPRLIARTIKFDPPLDGATAAAWLATPTWMAPHAKFVAVYDRPFWREMGLSGAGRSMLGPLAEIHDATTASGQAALFGFVGVPATRRAEVGETAVVAAAIAQLAAMYGPHAGSPTATLYKDWAADPLTATPEDIVAPGHPEGFRSARVGGPWSERLFLGGSEASSREPGYLVGAVDAAERAVSELITFHAAPRHRLPADPDRI